MVDVTDKAAQIRMARAEGWIRLQEETRRLIQKNGMKKGEVLSIAEFAGIQAAKQTASLIPLCHPLSLTHVSVQCTLNEEGVKVDAMVKCTGPTGVEMEALTAVSVALLTVYDMCKAADKEMVIHDIQLIEKTKTDH